MVRRMKKDFRKKRRRRDKAFIFRKRICRFCQDKVDAVDHKDVRRLEKFITERGKIVPRRISGNCARHQRQVSLAIKRARSIALLPFKAQ